MNFTYVYVLRSFTDGHWYTGYTRDLKKRFAEHQSGQTLSTCHRGPWQLIYYEASADTDDARAREKYLKSGMGKRFLKNRLKVFFKRQNQHL